MSEATGSLSFWDLVIEVATRKYRGIQKDRDWPTETELAGTWDDHSSAEIALAQEYIDVAKAIVNAGYKRFLIAHDWGFLTTRTTLIGWATDTETAVGQPSWSSPSSTVTIDTAMFYPSMVGQTLTFGTTETEWTIDGYSTNKIVTVTGNASSETAAQEVTVTATGTQRLPDDFSGQMIDEQMYFEPDGRGNAIVEVPMSMIINAQAGSNLTSQYSWSYGLETVQVGDYTRWNVSFWPRWATDTTIHYRYRKQIDILTSDASDIDYPLGGAEFSTAIREACLMMVEEDRGDPKGVAHESYNTTLAQAIQRDSKNKPRNRGYMSDNSDGPVLPLRHPTVIITHERG